MTTTTDEVTNLIAAIASAVEALALTLPALAAPPAVPGQPAPPTPLPRPLVVLREWPRHDRLQLPTLSILSGEVTRRHAMGEVVSCVPVVDEDPEAAPMVTLTRQEARLTVALTLDLWTASKTDRMTLKPHLERLFRPDPEVPHGLELTLADSHGTAARVRWLGDQQLDADDADDAVRRLTIRAEADLTKLRVDVLPAADFNVTTHYEGA